MEDFEREFNIKELSNFEDDRYTINSFKDKQKALDTLTRMKSKNIRSTITGKYSNEYLILHKN